MTVTVICEACGKMYPLPGKKLQAVQGHVVRTRCTKCGHTITIPKTRRSAPPGVSAYRQ